MLMINLNFNVQGQILLHRSRWVYAHKGDYVPPRSSPENSTSITHHHLIIKMELQKGIKDPPYILC